MNSNQQDILSARIARIVGDPIPVMSAPGNAKPMPRSDLGPNQLAWLRANVPSFEVCERLALGAERHRQEMLNAVKS